MTTTATTSRRPISTVHDLDELWIGSVVLTFDNLAWQAHSSADGGLLWTSSAGGQQVEVTSEDLLAVSQGYPVILLFDVELAMAA